MTETTEPITTSLSTPDLVSAVEALRDTDRYREWHRQMFQPEADGSRVTAVGVWERAHLARYLAETLTATAGGATWAVPMVAHDESRAVGPYVRGSLVCRDEGRSGVEHTRFYAAQLLAAADFLESRLSGGEGEDTE